VHLTIYIYMRKHQFIITISLFQRALCCFDSPEVQFTAAPGAAGQSQGLSKQHGVSLPAFSSTAALSNIKQIWLKVGIKW
jgi:hypothetical protein